MLAKAEYSLEETAATATPRATAKSRKLAVEPTSLNSNLSIPAQLDSIFEKLIKAP